MAYLAIISGVYVIGSFAGCRCTVVATETTAYDFVMIHRAGRNRGPGRRPGLMACRATIRGVNMIAGLARE